MQQTIGTCARYFILFEFYIGFFFKFLYQFFFRPFFRISFTFYHALISAEIRLAQRQFSTLPVHIISKPCPLRLVLMLVNFVKW